MIRIGGIHPPNLPYLLHASISPNSRNHLAGIAIISDIVGSRQPKEAAQGLRKVVNSFKRAREGLGHPEAIFPLSNPTKRDREELLKSIGELMRIVKAKTPLIHQVSRAVFSPYDSRKISSANEWLDYQQRRHK